MSRGVTFDPIDITNDYGNDLDRIAIQMDTYLDGDEKFILYDERFDAAVFTVSLRSDYFASTLRRNCTEDTMLATGSSPTSRSMVRKPL